MDFHAHQQRLSTRVRAGELRDVFLDPDGTSGDWLAVVIQWPTSVAYSTQCGGVSNELRFVEGYLVPLGGPRFDSAAQRLSAALFRDVFHHGKTCVSTWGGAGLPTERLAKLGELVRNVPFWRQGTNENFSRDRLELDLDRLAEICEGWVPVRTPDGAGILLFKNCD